MAKQKQNNDSTFNVNSADYINKRKLIQTEINSNRVVIDRSVFQKTPEERAQLKVLKSEHKNYMKRYSN